jgi:membrane protein implicated in regulation of membrane protease activity
VSVIWLVAGVLLAVAELFTADFVLIMLAGGAFAAALTGAAHLPVVLQITVFAAVSAFGLVLVRPAIKHRLHRNADRTPMGVAAIEGTDATVIEKISEETGMVKIGGELWTARPYDATQIIEAGERVRVVEVRGATVLVWKE